jgi:hypothetical protein
MSKKTMLGETQVNQSRDTMTIELVEPDDGPAFVKVHEVVTVELVERDGPAFVKVTWPPAATRIDPGRFGDAAAALVKMFSEAHVTLARIRSRRHRS